jgi:hypothetical protein
MTGGIFDVELYWIRKGLVVLLVLPWFAAAAEVDFNFGIRTILSDKLFHCHGPDGKKRVVRRRLVTFEGVTRDLGGYAAYGSADDFSFNPVDDPVHVHDLQATIIHQLGINHERLTLSRPGPRVPLVGRPRPCAAQDLELAADEGR